METNDSYLNRTANQTRRQQPGYRPLFVVWHETASPNSDNPHGTLDYNLSASVASSYNYLIARDGTIFHYLDETTRIAWHAGVNTLVTVGGRQYRGYDLNIASIGVEVDGPCDGTPITEAQRDAIVALLRYFNEQYRIPLREEYHPTHRAAVAAINPAYRSDPRGYSVPYALELARASTAPPPPDGSLRVLGLGPGPLPVSLPQWLRSHQRNKSAVRGLSIGAQQHLYGQCDRLRTHPGLLLGLLELETAFGQRGAGPAGNNWLNLREDDERAWSVVLENGIRYERHGTPELGIEAALVGRLARYDYEGLRTLRDVLGRWLSPHPGDGDSVDAAVKRVAATIAYVERH